MHILLALIGFITLLALWYHRIRMISTAARGTYKAAKGITNRARKSRRGQGLASITDPRQAAAVMMLQIARTRGAVTDRQDAVIREEMKAHFGLSSEEAEQMIAQAGWASRQSPPPHAVIARMSEIILSSPGIGPKDYDDLCAMLENVAVADGRATTAERDLIQIWRRKAGLN